MERPIFTNFMMVQFVVAMRLFSIFIQSGCAIESPHYTVVYSESDFEVRLYRECSWMSALVRGTTSFENSTKDGFHRLYQYFHGANLNSARVTLTAPVLTKIISNSSSSSTQGSEYHIKLYLGTKYERAPPPQPLPELNLQLDKRRSHCVAVRSFSGFAEDDNVGKEVEGFWNSLNKHVNKSWETPLVVDKSSFGIAQYNSSHHLTGRLNEVWVNVLSGFAAEWCLP
ncbi:hypothetical protein L484_027684 [Morus notabilis]|uniref:Heme-binding protein 2 n=1 Tax=Morus notabilis TaxID=981085 RepID=W9RCP1_9ROSA|nr:uncharacterized protein LOC21410294 [Morus notabilis]EXB82508.1 hypothetical protein L484_027684 [Morus notabilis]